MIHNMNLEIILPHIISIILMVLAYFFALQQAKNHSIREMRLKVYSELIYFIAKGPIQADKSEKEANENLLKHLAPARLIGTRETETLLRDYYEEVDKLKKEVLRLAEMKEKTFDAAELTKTIKQTSLDIEEQLRIDLGVRGFCGQRINRLTLPE